MPVEHVALGPVEFDFEPETGSIRYVRIGSIEVMRSIYAVVRDQNWSTPPNRITEIDVRKTKQAWYASWRADAQLGGVQYSWAGLVRAELKANQAVIEFEFEGQAKSDFLSNRTGICVLHPRGHQGLKCEIEHNHGECDVTSFPKTIRPDQPFKDVKAISLDVSAGIHSRTEFFGEVFETEDQRNYGDASFKTYSRPQEWKKPFEIKTGDKISQRVKLTIDFADMNPNVSLAASVGTLLLLGTAITRDLSPAEQTKVKELGAKCWLTPLTGLEQAKLMGGPVFLQSEVASVPAALSPGDGLCLAPPDQWQMLNRVRGAKRFATAPWAFMQLNGSRPAYDEIEGSAWSMQPCIHLTDTLTALEGGWTVEDQVNTARAFGSKQNLVGPIEFSGDRNDPRANSIEAALFALSAIAAGAKAKANTMIFSDATRLPQSGFALAFELLKDHSGEVEIMEWEPFFLMIRTTHVILVNLSWEPSELYKLCPIDRPENLENGIRNAYRLISEENFDKWHEVLAGPESHNPPHLDSTAQYCGALKP